MSCNCLIKLVPDIFIDKLKVHSALLIATDAEETPLAENVTILIFNYIGPFIPLPPRYPSFAEKRVQTFNVIVVPACDIAQGFHDII